MTLQESPHEHILAEYLNDAQNAKTLILENKDKVKSSNSLKESTAMPLSFLQEEVWLSNKLYPNDPTYNIYNGLYLKGDLQLSILQRSLNEIMQRHTILRTYFSEENGQAIQKVMPELSLILKVFDFRTLSEQQQRRKIDNNFIYEENTPFDLEDAPLWRVSLLRLADQSYLLSITFHHMIHDASSMEIFIQELTSLYHAFVNNEPSPLEAISDHYADFSHWQRQYFTTEMLQKRQKYWQKLLQNVPTPLKLPTDKDFTITQERQVYQSGLERFELSDKASQKLCEFGYKHSASPPIVLLALYIAMLYQQTGQCEMMIGLPVNRRKFLKRKAPQFMNLWGYFSGISVLHIQFDENPSFVQILKTVRRAMLSSLRNQDLTLKQVWNGLNLEWTAKQQQLFQTVFHFLPLVSRDEIQISDGLTFSSLPNRRGKMVRDLVIALWEKEGEKDSFEGALRYRQDMFTQKAISKLISHLQSLTETIAAQPEQAIKPLKI